ncbi:uncharacterized protein LOC110461239 [Mizuhopecten yessoensis]|uniref:uncharacterized protein LOC110461239 n=1 Tax=Mizuhopecten yessoensis TaxID=6573 RepID=UPI000B458B6E|nr:uncharacterized protein LOC110461239 [Mizuhopecten yessoensis]
MDMKYTIYQIIVIFTNIHMVTSGCQGDFIERNRPCRPKECQTQASFRPPQNCIDRNKREWNECRLKLKPRLTSKRGVSESASGHTSMLSMLSTGLVRAEAENSSEPVLNVSISYNKTNRDVDLVVNMTSLNDRPGDPYYYWLPDQRTVHLPTEKHNQTVKIMLSYRVFDTCSSKCTHHGCYLYVLHLIPMSREHLVLTYYITVFNITKNANLTELSLGWKSAIAVAVYPEGEVVHVVFEPIPPRLVHRQISYRIDLHKYPEQYEPVQTYKIPDNVTIYTHTFHGIKEGEYYVEVHCVRNNYNARENPWSRSQPFSVMPINSSSGENVTNQIEEGVNKSHIFTSLIIVAALGIVIFSTVCIFILHRKFPASGHKRQKDAVLIDKTRNNPRQVSPDKYGNNSRQVSPDEYGNNPRQVSPDEYGNNPRQVSPDEYGNKSRQVSNDE